MAMAEPMTLSRMRAAVRAGEYQDDVETLARNRLLFARWLAQQGWLNEWDVEEHSATLAPDHCARALPSDPADLPDEVAQVLSF